MKKKASLTTKFLNIFTPGWLPTALATTDSRHIQKQPHIDLRPARRQREALPDVRTPGVDLAGVTRIVLSDILQKRMHHFAIHDRVGRVVLASYQPHGQHDPVLPVPLMRLGPEFEAAYRNCAWVISNWVDAMFDLYYKCERYNNYTGYLHRMPAKPVAVYTDDYALQIDQYGYEAIEWAGASDQWTQEEWEYFHFQMRLSMTHPDRFTEYDNEKIRKIWRKAVAYNISLSR